MTRGAVWLVPDNVSTHALPVRIDLSVLLALTSLVASERLYAATDPPPYRFQEQKSVLQDIVKDEITV